MRLFLIAAAAVFVVAMTNVGSHRDQKGKQPEIAVLAAVDGSDAAEDIHVGAWHMTCFPKPHIDAETQEASWCSMQYVDRLEAGEPYGMLAAGVRAGERGLTVEFGLSGDLHFDGRGIRLVRNGFVVWRNAGEACLSNNHCVYTGPAAETLVEAFADETASSLELTFDIANPDGERGVRRWTMEPFADLYSSFPTGN